MSIGTLKTRRTSRNGFGKVVYCWPTKHSEEKFIQNSQCSFLEIFPDVFLVIHPGVPPEVVAKVPPIILPVVLS